MKTKMTKFIPYDVANYLELEELDGGKNGRVFIITYIDNIKYSHVHLSGPIEDVIAYYSGNMSFEEAGEKWRKKLKLNKA